MTMCGAGAGAGFGSVSAPWTPAALGAKLRGRWIGDGLTDPIGDISDQSGNSRTLSKVGSGSLVVATIGAHKGLDFPASATYEQRADGAVTGAASHTLIVCCRIDAAASWAINGIMAIGDGGTGFSTSAIGLSLSGADTKTCWGGENTTTPVGGILTVGNVYVLTKRYDGSKITGRVNGAIDVAPTSAGINVTGTKITLNHYKGNSGGLTPAGATILEAAYCDALLDEEVVNYERWMGKQYGVTVA